MRVSFTDQWQTLFDENGKPLVGRVKFMKADASQFKPVYYDNNGTQTLAPNPCYTLQDGRLEHQIFLDYGMYTCIVEKFIGADSSNMTDYADDTDYWQELKRFKAYGGEEKSSGTADIESGFVDTIADLRLVDPTEHGIVSVVGYYSKEDGIDPRTYVWVPENEDAEDFGSTILSSLSGYTNAGSWKLCETPIVCATTFGVFPNRNSTITPSDLSTKATALATYATSSPIVSMIHFNRGNYEFAEGTRLSFTKKVIAGDANVSNRYLKFGMFVEQGQTPSGTIEIAFIGGLELEQKAYICTNDYDSYTTFSFGAGVVRTSWLQNIEKHILASRSYEGLTIILDKSSAQTFYSNGQTISNWHFKGCDKQSYQVIGGNALFQSCSFEGKCFQVNNARFIDCGTLYQECICANDTKITDDVIWGSTGEVKSEGTTFVCNDIRMTKAYTGVVDNSCIKAIGDDAKIVSTFPLTFKNLDRDWQLYGKIGFENSDTMYASQYYDFSDCVDYALAHSKVVDLEKLSRSYTIDTTGVSASRLFVFKNGTLTLTKTGTGSVKDFVSVEDTTLIVDNSFSQIGLFAEGSNISGVESSIYSSNVDLNLNDCNITAGSSGAYIKSCSAVDTKFIGSFSLVNDENGEFKQNFDNCHFNSQLKFYAAGSSTKVKSSIIGCTFEISNSGTPISAIALATYSGASFANESESRYTIEGNLYLGDVYLLPTKKSTFRLTSSTDGTTTPTADWDVSIGTLQTLSNDEDDTFYAEAQKLSDYNFISSKFFHFGTIDNLVVKAKPLTQVTNYHFDLSKNCQILPISDCVKILGQTQTTSVAVYNVIGDSLTPPFDFTNIMPTIVWLVEIEKV